MAQGDQQQFCLRWNDFQTNMVSSFKHLRDEKSFTDVTLACDGQTCKAHKMVLSACSPYFKVCKIVKNAFSASDNIMTTKDSDIIYDSQVVTVIPTI